jgi:hypothetical protein
MTLLLVLAVLILYDELALHIEPDQQLERPVVAHTLAGA